MFMQCILSEALHPGFLKHIQTDETGSCMFDCLKLVLESYSNNDVLFYSAEDRDYYLTPLKNVSEKLTVRAEEIDEEVKWKEEFKVDLWRHETVIRDVHCVICVFRNYSRLCR